MGDYDTAIKSMENTLNKWASEKGTEIPLGWRAIWELMRCYEHKLDFLSAIKAYNSFKLIVPPQDARGELSKFRVAYYHLQLGEYEEAYEIWQEIIGETEEGDYLHNLSIMLSKNYQESSPIHSKASPESKETARIIGDINNQISDANEDFLKGEVLIIYGSQGKNEKENSACERAAIGFREFSRYKYGYSLLCKKDIDVSLEELRRNHLVLFGTPLSNKILASLSDVLPIKIGENRLEIGNRAYEGENIGVIMLIPNPYNKDKFVLLYSAFSPSLQEKVQSIFHGPTDYVIFSEDSSEEIGIRIIEVGFFKKHNPNKWETL